MTSETFALTPEMITDANRGYSELRRRGSLVRVTLPDLETPTWLAMRHEDVVALLSDRRFVRDASTVFGPDRASVADQMIEAYGLPAEYREYLDGLVLHDGDEHTRRRREVSRTFTARRIADLRPWVEELASRLVENAAARDSVDLLGDVLNPLAGRVICHLVGIDEADHGTVCEAMRQYHSGDNLEVVAGLRTIVDMTKGLIARRRTEPREDLVSELVGRGRSSDQTSETEIIAMVFLLVNTGRTPPALFLANAVLELLDHPDQLAGLRRDRKRLSQAITELLRRTAPVTIGAPHYATEDLVFGGTQVHRGEVVTPALHAAHHDLARFEDPHVLDLTRETGRTEQHISFGRGPHYCLGAALAKLESEVVLARLFFRHRPPALGVRRDQLKFSHYPGEGLHLVQLPLRL
jgi:cytochrome P450